MGPNDRRWPLIAAAAGLTALLASCSPPAEQATPAPAPAPPTPTPIPIPSPPPPLGRAELLSAVNTVAAEFASAAADYPAAAAALDGRRFELRLPLGCAGPGPETAPLRYSYDTQRETLKLTAVPEVWTETPWVRVLERDAEAEAIEGFWISRPWLLTETCPPIPATRAPAPATTSGEDDADDESAPAPSPSLTFAPSPETVGIAQVFEAGGSRLLRRAGRPYEVTRKAPTSESPQSSVYRLVVSGRVTGGADGQPIRCRSLSPDRRPTCLVRVEFTRIAFEDAAGEMLAEWTS